MSVGEYADARARRRSTSSSRRTARRSSPAERVSTSVRRSPTCEIPPAVDATERERAGSALRRRPRSGATRGSRELDPRAAAVVHAQRPPPRRASARARRDRRLARRRTTTGSGRRRCAGRRSSSASTSRRRSSSGGSERGRRDVRARRRRRGPRGALRGPISRTAAKALGLRELATLPPEEAARAIVVRTRRYAAYQRKWMRRIPGIVMIDADRPSGAGGGCDSRSGTRSVTHTCVVEPAASAARREPRAIRRSHEGTDGVARDPRRRRRRRVDVVDLEPGRVAGGAVGKRDADRRRVARSRDRRRSRSTSCVGERTVATRMLDDGEIEQDLGTVDVGAPESSSRRDVELCRSRWATRTPSSSATATTIVRSVRCSRRTALSRAHERPGRPRRRPGRGDGARLGARRGGDAVVGTSAVAVAAARTARRRRRPLPGGIWSLSGRARSRPAERVDCQPGRARRGAVRVARYAERPHGSRAAREDASPRASVARRRVSTDAK